MKKRILALVLLLSLSLSACVEDEMSKEESKGEISTVVSEENSSFINNSEEENIFEESEFLSEESVISEGSCISEEAISEEISEMFSEESSEAVSEYVSEESSVEESSVPDSSYEIMDTPIIPVPDKVESAEEDAFFNDSVFVGNSIMLGYQKFANKQRAGNIPDFLGNSKFFVAGSFGVYHNNRTPASKENSCNPSYEGVKYSVEDAVGVMNAKTVYINFMGLNDLSLYYDSENCSRKCADDVIKLIRKINDRYPDVNVVILSATYLTASRNNRPSLNNKNLSMLNNYLLEYCNENGLDFVDIASQLTEKGCLADKYASDGYCHIWTDGYKVWTAILRDYAVRKMNGTYTNPERMPLLGINKN